ncbi:MAG: HlyC/CorC family transporter [Acetobacteraceae bacterium]|nr:HlyC/CorC family transporter [Acetobacteraceae bacterium]
MSLAIEIVFILVLIVLNGLFAMSELALVSARRARLLVMESKGARGAAVARALAEDPQRFFPTVQVGITLVGILAGVFGGARIAAHIAIFLERLPGLAPFAESTSLALVVVVITYLTMIFGELVPKQLALRFPEAIAARVAKPLAQLASVASPVVWVLSRSSALVMRLFGLQRQQQKTITEEELKALLAEGAQAGVLETEERDMIERILRLADKPVRAIMTPRTEIIWIDRNDSRADIIETLTTAPYSRFVVSEGEVDNVVGVVQAKELLDRILTGGELSVPAALRQPLVVPDSVSALDALERLKADPFGLALVMDEYGSFEGVVTAADVLEAIVGDPADTSPSAESGPLGDDAAIEIDGLMPVDELKARLGLPALPSEGTYYTLAGLLLALLRRVPQAGDRIIFAGWRFEILAMDGRRVDKVRATREPAVAGRR